MDRSLPSLPPSPATSSPLSQHLPKLLVHISSLLIVCLILVSAGQPIVAEDTWWHLTMGGVYLNAGPWLEADPLLHTAVTPPAPAAWLADVVLYGVQRVAGLQGLRVAHVLAVAAILGLAWAILRRASGSAAYASFATAIFANLAGYRLFQLRPHLFSIFATLLVVWLLLLRGRDDDAPPSWPRVAVAALLMGLWANVHASFVLGPIVVGAGIAGLAIALLLSGESRTNDRMRIVRLSTALTLGLVSTLANPAGLRLYAPFLSAGVDSPELSQVVDEWSRVDLFELSPANLPPSLLSWLVVWCLLLALLAMFVLTVQMKRAQSSEVEASLTEMKWPDPALVGVTLVSLFLVLFAVRFLWLGIVPLLLLGCFARDSFGVRTAVRPRLLWLAAIAALLLLPMFWFHGDWPMISRMIRPATYGEPYSALKYRAHGVWFMRDADLEGNLFNDYSVGNFLGYWLSPGLRMFVNGSLNLPKEAMTASYSIGLRAWQSDQSLDEILDRYEVDVFFGIGVPVVSQPGRKIFSTTTHLENSAGWIPVFRSIQSAVYLREGLRNRANLQRVIDYYARAGVPFDSSRGFDVDLVRKRAPQWALEHGLIPTDLNRLINVTRTRKATRGQPGPERLASVFATIGLYAEAVAIDERTLRWNPSSVTAARRIVWCLLHQGLDASALESARRLSSIATADDALSARLVDAAKQVPNLSRRDAAALVAILPVFTPPEATRVSAGFQRPESRQD